MPEATSHPAVASSQGSRPMYDVLHACRRCVLCLGCRDHDWRWCAGGHVYYSVLEFPTSSLHSELWLCTMPVLVGWCLCTALTPDLRKWGTSRPSGRPLLAGQCTGWDSVPNYCTVLYV